MRRPGYRIGRPSPPGGPRQSTGSHGLPGAGAVLVPRTLRKPAQQDRSGEGPACLPVLFRQPVRMGGARPMAAERQGPVRGRPPAQLPAHPHRPARATGAAIPLHDAWHRSDAERMAGAWHLRLGIGRSIFRGYPERVWRTAPALHGADGAGRGQRGAEPVARYPGCGREAGLPCAQFRFAGGEPAGQCGFRQSAEGDLDLPRQRIEARGLPRGRHTE